MKNLLFNPLTIACGYILFAISFGVVIILGLSRRILDSAQYQSDNTLLIHNEMVLRQTIKPVNPGLNTIMVYLKNSGQLNHDPFRFRLVDESGQVVREIYLNGSNIGEADNVRFQFSPVVDSAGQIYIIELMSDTPSNKPTIKAGISKTDSYPEGQLISDEVVGPDLSFQLFYRPQDRLMLMKEVANYVYERASGIKLWGLLLIIYFVNYFVLKKILLPIYSK
jgi:hypothetical protein